jgi:hypothetical protein
MRAVALALGGFVTIGAVVGFAGCGSSIETAATGGHGGSAVTSGTGGTATSTTTGVSAVSGTGGSAVSSSVSTSVVSSSSSTGGVDMACQAACAHVDMCNLGFSCSDVSFLNCSNINSADDCIFDCIAGTPCSSIGFSTLQSCQAECKDGGAATTSSSSSGFGTSSVASSSSGNPGGSCQSCSVQSCGGPIGACTQNQACLKWLECSQPCIQATPLDPACFAACDMANAGASALYGPVYTCACSMCTTQCGAIPECGDAGP